MPLTRGVPAAANGWEQLVYASALQQSIMLSIYHQRSSEANETFLGYNFDTNSWDIVDMGGLFHTENVGEGGETQGYFGYNPNNNTIVYYCCTTGSNQPENVFHTWWYDVLGQSGLDKETTLKPPATALQPGGAFDVAHDTFVVFGGDSFVGTWTYSPVSNTWQHITTNGTAPDPSLILSGMAYSTTAGRVYLFGGSTATGYNSNLYYYDVPSNTWTLVTPTGASPPGRTAFGFAYDSTNNVFLLYGGENASGVLGDTWVFNPATNSWTQLTPPQSPPVVAGTPVWARLAYDSDHNAFVLASPGSGGYFGGSWTAYSIQTWLFRYQGGGPNAGTLVPTAQAASGSIDRNTASWGKDPALVSSGSSLYVAWSELSSPFDPSDAAWPHIYVSQYSGGNWLPVGSSYSSISPAIDEAHLPAITLVGATPWVSWYQGSNQPGGTPAVSAASWNGSTWTSSAIGLVGTDSFQGRSQMMGIGSVPYVAFTEVNKTYYPQETFAYAKTWNGTSWALLGGALNRNTGAGTTADAISIANDGTNPWVAWTEYVKTYGSPGDTDSSPQVYVSYWNGTQWVAVGGSLNVNSSNWAYDAAITYLGTQPYVAWTERTTTGSPQLYVKTWNGTSWVLVGSGSLNQNPATGWALHPSLAVHPSTNSLYLGWVEQSALGQNAQVYVSEYSGGTWTSLGASLNADPINGSAQRVSVGVYNGGEPVAAWGEVNAGWLRQIYVKQWNGSTWTQLSGSGGPADTIAPTTPTGLSATALSANQISLAWTASTDTVGVTGYRIFRGGSQIGASSEAITYQDTTVSPNTSYSYTVAAYDAAGNFSSQSVAANATTPAGTSPPPTVSVTAPASGATLSGTVTVSANATSTVGMAQVQFRIDGINLGSAITGAGPSYSTSWNTTTASNTTHMVSAVATDTAGNNSTSSISVTVNNPVVPPVISAVAAGSITSSGASITWTTDQASTSQVAYGTTSAYGSKSALNSTLVTGHLVSLTGLAASTTYHFQVLSQNAAGALASSGDFTFTTTAASPYLLQIQGNAGEVSGVTNGSIVTPTAAPAGFTGNVVVNGTGTVNYAAAQTGNGVYFLNCCSNTNNAFYQFTGATVGNIFNINQGQITFALKSRYSFAQRQANAASPRYTFDVRDGSNNHLFYFLTEISSSRLLFSYVVGGAAQFYYVPAGTEDTLFGSGVIMQVTLAWNGSTVTLALNGAQASSSSYTPTTPNWTAASNFNLGGYEYLTYGGYNSSDDIINAFSVQATAALPTVSVTAPASGAALSGTVSVSANATSAAGMAQVQFQIDGANLGAAVTGAGPSYSTSWNTTTASNTTHKVSAVATDLAGNSSTSSISVTVNNPVVPPVISAVAAGSITSSGATITWTTDQASTSQVSYGTTSAYGSMSALNSTLVTAHSTSLTGLAASTTYHFQALSKNATGTLASSGDFTFTTTAASPYLLQIQGNAGEVSGVTNGSIVTPTVAPVGFTGSVVVNGTGSVNYTPAQTGNGVYFLNCCSNTNDAYYNFTGATVGNIFNINQGQITFYLESRYSFAQRQANAASPRFAFDVRDGNGNHLFYFLTEIISSRLLFSYVAGSPAQFYYVPKGTEDTLFGSGVIMQVALAWNGSTVTLSLNGMQVKSSSYTPATPNWTAASAFDLGAYEYLTYGGYDVSDDIVNEFTVPISTSPAVSVTAPANGATLSGTVSVSANATSAVGVAQVQFQIDGVNLGGGVTGTGPSYSTSWNTATAGNTTHTVSAVATDLAGNSSTSSISATVNNPVVPPVISAVAAGSIISSGASITWTTDQASTSQVAYGTMAAYGFTSTLNSTLVTAHSVSLTGLAASTTYHFQVLSQNAAGALASSGDFTFTTAAPPPSLQIQGNAGEVSGVTNGSIVTPTAAPAGFTGSVVVNGAGTVNYTAAQTGNGVYFLNCCSNTNDAYYKFTGATVGNIFNINQGQITFALESRYSFAQRQANAASPRYTFDVRDGSNNHLFYFLTEISSSRLLFSYVVGGAAQFYYVPAGTEDTLFGSGVIMQVTLAWNGSTVTLALNGAQASSSFYTPTTPNWTAASNLDLGAYEYLTYGGYNVSDDVVNQFTVQ